MMSKSQEFTLVPLGTIGVFINLKLSRLLDQQIQQKNKQSHLWCSIDRTARGEPTVEADETTCRHTRSDIFRLERRQIVLEINWLNNKLNKQEKTLDSLGREKNVKMWENYLERTYGWYAGRYLPK